MMFKQKKKTQDGFNSEDLFKTAFNSPTVHMSKKTKTYQDMLNNLASNGDGAYGNLTMYWKLGGGHSVFWKNEKGRTRIYDGQSGEEFSGDFVRNFTSYVDMKSLEYNRLDNCKPTEYTLGLVESRK